MLILTFKFNPEKCEDCQVPFDAIENPPANVPGRMICEDCAEKRKEEKLRDLVISTPYGQ